MNCFKNKSNAIERENYRGLKLLEHMMKVFEMFAFIPGKGNMNVIFIARQLQERYLEKKKKLFFAFVDLEKAFDQVPREVVK